MILEPYNISFKNYTKVLKKIASEMIMMKIAFVTYQIIMYE